jgi:hypothetical protein
MHIHPHVSLCEAEVVHRVRIQVSCEEDDSCTRLTENMQRSKVKSVDAYKWWTRWRRDMAMARGEMERWRSNACINFYGLVFPKDIYITGPQLTI